jgi:dTDP-4-dehydrorhamnose reductase
MIRVLVLGANGMLGHACMDVMRRFQDVEAVGTARGERVGYIDFDAHRDPIAPLLEFIKPHWIINCIGVIKPYIREADPISVINAIRINSEFPFNLAKSTNSRIIQIATDCVYTGFKGLYMESDLHDATDVYGKTKSLGEIEFENVTHLRVSIIGPELDRSTSLLEWFRNQPLGSTVNGFTDHLWNGVTTYHFAKIAYGIISNNVKEVSKTHIVPADIISKADLLQEFAVAFGRGDIQINRTLSSVGIDRTLSTLHPEVNRAIWDFAGYELIPTVSEMVHEQARVLSIG